VSAPTGKEDEGVDDDDDVAPKFGKDEKEKGVDPVGGPNGIGIAVVLDESEVGSELTVSSVIRESAVLCCSPRLFPCWSNRFWRKRSCELKMP
jgi:hypothetical protein